MNNKNSSRKSERNKEDESYIPVIVKRNDNGPRHPDDTLNKAILEGLEQHERTIASLFLSALAAGLILGFAAMSVALITKLFPSEMGLIGHRLAVAAIYPLGFIICIISGTQLFTEQTATALYPVLDKKASSRSLLKIWGIILIGNLVGTLISSLLLFLSESVINAQAGFLSIYEHLIEYSFLEIFISAILAGWLMAQGGWLVLITPPSGSQAFCIYIVTFLIGFGGLHHSIAGSAEIFSGILHSQHPQYFDSIKFLIASVLGNLFGGSIFVGILNYGHIRKTQ